jgi:hypothetical protein
MPYNEEIMEADRKYQKEQTVQNELVLEKAKLKYWEEELKGSPGDKELLKKVKYHRDEVERLEQDIPLA